MTILSFIGIALPLNISAMSAMLYSAVTNTRIRSLIFAIQRVLQQHAHPLGYALIQSHKIHHFSSPPRFKSEIYNKYAKVVCVWNISSDFQQRDILILHFLVLKYYMYRPRERGMCVKDSLSCLECSHVKRSSKDKTGGGQVKDFREGGAPFLSTMSAILVSCHPSPFRRVRIEDGHPSPRLPEKVPKLYHICRPLWLSDKYSQR